MTLGRLAFACPLSRLSELRIIELLEGLCSAMIDYEFVPANKNGSSSSKARWARSSELGVNRSFDLNKWVVVGAAARP